MCLLHKNDVYYKVKHCKLQIKHSLHIYVFYVSVENDASLVLMQSADTVTRSGPRKTLDHKKQKYFNLFVVKRHERNGISIENAYESAYWRTNV